MKNKLLRLSALAMALSATPEIVKNTSIKSRQKFNPYANKLCKSCKYISKESGYCTCRGGYKKLKSKACKNYKSKNK